MVLSSQRNAIARVRPVHMMNADSAPNGRQINPQTKPIDLGCESAGRKAAVIHIHHRHFIIRLLTPKADTHFTIPWRVEG